GVKPSLETDNHGLFTAVLIDGLKGKADMEGYEPDGNIMASELAKYFKKEFADRARAIGKNNDEKGQSGGVIDLHTTDFVIDHNPAAFGPSAERLKKFDAVIKEKSLSKETAEEGVNLLTRMPKLDAQQKLRQAYQKLADGDINVEAFESKRKEILDS